MIEEASKQKALAVFNSFESLMKPFLDLFPEGQITWSKGLISEYDFEGEFYVDEGSYIRFTEEIKKKEE